MENKKPKTDVKEDKIKEKIFEMNADNIKKDSLAEKKRIIFKMQKKLFKARQKLAEFKEPVLILMRRTGKAEWFDNATSGKFEYTHSDGEERFIILDQSFQQTFDYGGHTFKGYVCHEDFPTPFPDNPIVTTELVAIMHEKILNDIKAWKVEQEKAKALKIRSWAIFAAVIGGIFLLYIIFKPTPQQAIDVANATINATINATKETSMTLIQ